MCVEGGKTKLTFRASWLARVRSKGWRMTAIRPAVKRGRVMTMPIVKTGKLTLFRRSMVGGLSSCFRATSASRTRASVSAVPSTTRAALPFCGARLASRSTLLSCVPNTFYWRGPVHQEQGEKGPGSGTFGRGWSGSPSIDFPVSPNRAGR